MGNCCSSSTADPVPQREIPLQVPIPPSIPPSIPASIPVSIPPVEPSVSEIRRPRSRSSIKSVKSARRAPRHEVGSSYERPRVKSAPQKVQAMKDKMEDAPPLPHPVQRSRAKSSTASSSRSPNSDHRQTSAEHSRESPRRPTMSYPARRPLNSTLRQVLPENFRFRILVVGKFRSGKSSLIKTVFKVDMTTAPEKADINIEFRPDDNRYLIVHEFSGLDSRARDSEDLQTIRDFISRRTDASRTPPERLHAVWICVPASDAIDGRLGGGIEEILGLRSVPVVLVFTKFDVVVSQVLFDIGGDAQHTERAWTRAITIYEESCRRLFHKEPRDVPAEIVSEKSRFIDLIDNLIWTTDSFITNSRAPSGGHGTKQRVGAIPLAWSAAVRVNHDIPIQASIEIGRCRYWRSLWSSLDFADQTLKNCVRIIHNDIVEIWNLNDKTRYLSGERFKVKMSHLVKDLAGSAKVTPGGSGSTRDDYADWVNDLYRGSQENVRCVVGYIIDLTVVMDGIFRTAAGDMSPKDAQQVLERHIRSGHRDAIHRDIQSFLTEAFAIRFAVPKKDLVLERIIDLIRQYCVPP